MTLPARLAAAAVLASALVAPSVALAQGKPKPAPAPQESAAKVDLVERGRALFEDQQYEDSIQVLSAALLSPGNTTEQKIEIYRLLALDYITLGRKDEAESAVRGLLVIAPDYQLPAKESPRFRDFFAQVRTRWEGEGRPGIVVSKPAPKPVVLRHSSPPSIEPDHGLELRGRVDDPEHRVAKMRLFFRSGSKGDFTEVEAERDAGAGTFRAQIPAASVRPPLVEYYLVALDEGDDVVVSRGDAQSPLRVAVTEPSKGWVLPVAIGGGILGAAAIVGGLALAGVFKSSSSSPSGPGTSIVSVSVREASR